MTATHKAAARKTPAAKAPATKTPATKAPAASGSTTAGQDAIALLKADHAEVKKCFKDYQKLVDQEAGSDDRQAATEQICLLLTVHAMIEEEIFYPAAREVLGDEVDLIDEADVEHASAKELIAQIRAATPDEDHYDAKVKVLGEYIDHHVKEEQDELFPKVRKAKLDIKALGAELEERKQALMAEMLEGVEA